jgi:hypothetical protein
MAVLLDQAWVKVQAKTFTKWCVLPSSVELFELHTAGGILFD